MTRLPSVDWEPSCEPLERVDVLGIPVHLAADYGLWLRQRAAQSLGTHVVTLNSEMTIQALEVAELGQIIRKADLVVPDGAGITLYLRFLGRGNYHAPGIELVESLLATCGDWPVFFLGGAPGVADQAVAYWQRRRPDLVVTGTQHGYLNPELEAELERRLQALQPCIILVALGVPRQEVWIRDHRHLCPQAIWIGVGGSFDIWAGRKTRAPRWMRKLYLEWAYRLYKEPWRWRRMLALPLFAWRALVPALLGRIPAPKPPTRS
ncbi:MAG: WecB/TagA/CpsF family glycosyltransferase [Gloeomargaritaceae cyanobacterium C42_A2020_066]|nr:WecB/TagA/CpsF family glycosyltransferase [Gloeomargaritaceae cyanobacterium C42_A2020_066]